MSRLFMVLVILTFLSLSLASSPQKKVDREIAELTGAVRSVRSEMVDYVEGDSQEISQPKQLGTVTYNAQGNELERIIYDDYGFLAGKEVHAFHANGKLLESNLTDPEGTLMQRRTYVHTNGRISQIVSYDGKGSVVLKQLNYYLKNGWLREEIYYDRQKSIGKTVYRYDKNGNISEIAYFKGNGSKAVAPIGPCLGAHRVIYSYDTKGKPVKVVVYEPDGEVKKSWQYSYNSVGQIAEDLRESAWSRTRFVYTYEYDSNGNWTKRIATVIDESKMSPMESFERKVITSREIDYY